MGVFEGLWEVRNVNIPIIKENIHSMGMIGRVRKGDPNYINDNPCGLVIKINTIKRINCGYVDLSLEEQIRTLIPDFAI